MASLFDADGVLVDTGELFKLFWGERQGADIILRFLGLLI